MKTFIENEKSIFSHFNIGKYSFFKNLQRCLYSSGVTVDFMIHNFRLWKKFILFK